MTILMTVGAGVPVQDFGRVGEWRQVSVAGKTGWIRSDYLADESPKEPEATEPTSGREVLQGRASVIDGDTFEIDGKHVRLNGIDAPESEQQCKDAKGFRYSCGWQAAEALDKFLAKSRPVRCEFVSWDSYGRFVGDCFRADGVNVAAWLVEQGHALDWPKYSDGRYASQQVKAKNAGRGIWQGTFDKPWEWRSSHPDGVEQHPPTTTSDDRSLLSFLGVGCNIKGNLSKSGERIYHVPGQKYYSATRINPMKGERWFCSESEARAAGWRKSNV